MKYAKPTRVFVKKNRVIQTVRFHRKAIIAANLSFIYENRR
ncbi:hypothetical protein HMPREF1870_02291 [Bacteroidales bacterium KA00344]|nr:hypothetical protein HMPREF1870_02291 [Bacteroidales bacterium KA00344]